MENLTFLLLSLPSVLVKKRYYRGRTGKGSPVSRYQMKTLILLHLSSISECFPFTDQPSQALGKQRKETNPSPQGVYSLMGEASM